MAPLQSNGALTKLSLRDCGADVPGTAALADALSKNRTLSVLDLWGNALGGGAGVGRPGDSGGGGGSSGGWGSAGAMAPLADVLRGNAAPLTALNVGDAGLGPEGAVALAAVLGDDSCGAWRLRTLEVWGNGIGATGAGAIAQALKANSTLTALGLSDNGVGDAGVAPLADALRAVCTIGGGASRGASSVAEGHPADVAAAGVGAAQAQGLDGSGVDSIGLGVAGGGSRSAVGLDRAVGVVAGAGGCALRTLELWGNAIGPVGAALLADALAPSTSSLPSNTTLTSLDLRDNALGPAGAIAHAAARCALRCGCLSVPPVLT